MRYTGIYKGYHICRPYGSYRILKINDRRFKVAFDILEKEIEYVEEGEEITIHYLTPEKFMIKKN